MHNKVFYWIHYCFEGVYRVNKCVFVNLLNLYTMFLVLKKLLCFEGILHQDILLNFLKFYNLHECFLKIYNYIVLYLCKE